MKVSRKKYFKVGEGSVNKKIEIFIISLNLIFHPYHLIMFNDIMLCFIFVENI